MVGLPVTWKVTVSKRIFLDPDLKYTMGLWWEDDEDPTESYIAIHPKLRGIQAYRTFVHEVGHAYGLDHIPKTIMAANGCLKWDELQTEPTPEMRKRWCLELHALVMDYRWAKAA